MNVKAFVKKYTMVIALVAVFILFGLLTHGRLFYPQNMSNLMLQNSYVLVLACGMLCCILTGGNIDLSVGSTVCLVGALAAQLMDKNGMNAYLVIFICLVVGAVIGGWQGFWIGYIHIPPFICTLSGMFLFRGLGRVILASKTVPVKDKTFLNIFASYIQIPGLDDNKIKMSAMIVGVTIAVIVLLMVFTGRAKRSRKGYAVGPLGPELLKKGIIAALIVFYAWKLANYKGIPVMLIWVLAVVFIYAFITSKTALGRYFYAVGGNEKATKLSGIDTRKVYFLAYLSMSFLIPATPSKWTPSAPASSAALPLTAAPVRLPASASVLFSSASSTRACPSSVWTTTGSTSSRARCFWLPLSLTSFPTTRQAKPDLLHRNETKYRRSRCAGIF